MHDKIVIKGARMHNLKDIDVELPRNKLIVITGLSGSGKSSLAFDTIYAEGQRRYVESLSAYARQFLGLMDKPDVDQIEGLSPAISIDQKTASHNPRSTVGTVTEIYDYLRLLYARVGRPHCPECGILISKQTVAQIFEKVASLKAGTRIMVIGPVIRDKKGEHKHVLEEVRKAGFVRVRVDGIIYPVEEAEDLSLDRNKKHDIEVVVDRLEITEGLKKAAAAPRQGKARKSDERTRLIDSLEAALDLGNGLVIISLPEKGEDLAFSSHFSCPECGMSLPEIEPRNFSFNSPHGACPGCTGLGTRLEVDQKLVIPNKKLSIAEGAIKPWVRVSTTQGSWAFRMLEDVAREFRFSLNDPVASLSKKQLDAVFYGTDGFEGVIPNLERRHRETESDYVRKDIENYMRVYPCETCKGRRLREEMLHVTVAGESIADVTGRTIEQAMEFFQGLVRGVAKIPKEERFTRKEGLIARTVLKEIVERLGFLQDVGLLYLTLDRAANTLSGGEAQRIRLATQIGSALTGVLYILDEPSIGLHQKDNQRLIATLKKLRDLGNTVIVVEHDEETIRTADHVVDIGPGAGKHGGHVVAEGTPRQIEKDADSITGRYLAHQKQIELPKKYRKGSGKEIVIKGASEFNLQDIDVALPLGKFIAITGVSGSGKSTLMTEILSKALRQHFYKAKALPGKHKEITGLEHIDKVIDIDQSPIGRTPRSNPATYTGLFTPIRDLFAQLPEAKIRGYKPGRFSFNVVGGRCEACQGEGLVKIEMQFLPNIYVECDECHGQRYSPESLEIHYKSKNIADVLNMTVDEAMSFFKNIPAIHDKLHTLHQVGLGYIHLGQSATTLSGGEAQRVKLASELSRRATGKTLYILDEPTTGLHFEDVRRLLSVLNKLADKGNTVLIIEHNLDVIKSVDWVVDLGPEGGDKGGHIVAQGTPKDVAKIKASFTGQYLKKML